jgi:hypothetical protein
MQTTSSQGQLLNPFPEAFLNSIQFNQMFPVHTPNSGAELVPVPDGSACDLSGEGPKPSSRYAAQLLKNILNSLSDVTVSN